MNRYIIGSLWDRNNRNGANKNFEYLFEGRQKIDELNYRAEGILTEAIKTNDMNKNVQQQINTLIAESGTSDAEVLQARVDANGTIHNTVKDRIDKDQIDLEKLKGDLKLQRANASEPLYIETYVQYDNHAVHPSVVEVNQQKYGAKYVMAFTPYSEMRDRYENPSIVTSNDMINWRVPKGIINPIVPNTNATDGYFSDPDIIDNGTELEMYYRYTRRSDARSRIYRKRTTNLLDWTQPEIVFDYNEFDPTYMSPSVVLEGNIYKIYYRNGSGELSVQSSTGGSTWGSKVNVPIDYGEYSEIVQGLWHLEVRKIDDKYYLTANVNLVDNGSAIIILDSTNGQSFSNANLVMLPSLSGFDNNRLYRASLVKFGVWFYLFYSGFGRDNSNHIGLSRAGGAMQFNGISKGDLDFNRATRGLVSNFITGYQDRFVSFTTGIEIFDNLKLVNPGVAGFNLKSNRSDTMKVSTDAGDKSGYVEAAGMYLSSDNDSIQGINNDNSSLWRDSSSNRLVKGIKKDQIMHSTSLVLYGTSKNYVIQSGTNEIIDSVVSDSLGFKIIFKNLNSSMTPFVTVMPADTNGLFNDSLKISFFYIRELSHNHCIIGMNRDIDTTAHTPLDTITGGAVRLMVTY